MKQASSPRSKEYFSCSLPICHGALLETVHKLPASGARRNAWLAALNDYRDRLENMLNPSICARHFRPEDYVHAESRKLNRVAVPSLNIKELNQLDICRQVRNYGKKPNVVRADENIIILQSKCWTKAAKKEANLPKASEIECNQRKLTTEDDRFDKTEMTDITRQIDEEQNVYITLDELETSLQERNDVMEVKEYTDNVEDVELEDKSVLSSAEDNDFEEMILDDVYINGAENATETETIAQTSVQDNDSIDISSTNDICIQLDSNEIVIQHVSCTQPLSLNYLWLRDFCRCADCYDSATHARLFDVTALSMELRPYSASLFQDNILIEWNDGHVSKYVISQLFAQQESQKTCLIPQSQTPWSAKQTRSADFEAIKYNDLICDSVAIKTAFKRLQQTGALLIKDISANAQQKPLMLELLLRRLFPHNYQRHSKEERSNFCHSQPLPHTNCTFLSESCGLQLLSLSSACALKMVQINILDGLYAVKLLKQYSCQAFDYLTQHKTPFIYRNAQNFDYHTEAMTIQLRNGELERFKFSPYQRGNMDHQNMQQFVAAFSKLTSIIKQKQQQWQLCLTNDMLLILDNWRICWQVEKLESDIVLDCVYMERKEFLSQLHCLQKDS